ncbi:precorrin-2 dehydrogenase/sirohydrochlorin ferrochelatase family protein, partial [Nocardioides kribbensis]|uniref:precorrin-2 dehydrogenase/sirohydrochlorin ferrochelatase family protein n=1 Tax=Nocardioides kribbensis TaxID=305517 RepID=UPI0032D9F14D
MDDFPTYLSGLRLHDRRVVVVGGGHVAQRRIPLLIAVGARVVVVSPDVTPAIEGLVGGGEVTWHARGFDDADLDDAWYAVAAIYDQAVNERVSAAAEARRVFCVRADDAMQA